MKVVLVVFLFLAALTLQALSYAQWYTNMGDFRCELPDELVPITAGNFIDLARANFYDGLIFHRVVAGFVIQDGDPLGNGYGGPGYTIPDEFVPELRHDSAGVLAMANAGPNTGGSQYYITLEATPWLDDSYSIFGHVVQGMDVVYAIGAVDVDANDCPLTPVQIDSIRVYGFQVSGIYPDQDSLSVAGGTVLSFYVLAAPFEDDPNPSFTWYRNGVDLGITDFMTDLSFNTAGVDSIRCRVSDGTYEMSYCWTIAITSTGVGNHTSEAVATRMLGCSPNPFNPSTTVTYSLANSGAATIEAFNLRGQVVRSWSFPSALAGTHSLRWDGTDDHGAPCASGVYFFRLKSGADTGITRGLLLK
jgi:cyclophilin family peptidyl-prolyl cis-trans isomerase